MKLMTLRSAAALTTFLIGISCAATGANAAFVINATVGGAPTGVNYVNFDDLPLGSAGGTSGGVGVSFAPEGAVVVNASEGYYAAPYISATNGLPFGDPTVSGPDGTYYISTGIGSATLTLPGSQLYLGLLWGSVDDHNRLEFFLGADSVGVILGTDIWASANGDQGILGTFYTNIVSDLAFDRVVASSTQRAFEFDNLAYNATDPNTPVPEPLSLGLMGLGLLGIGMVRRRKTTTV